MESLNQESENNIEKAQATAIKVTEDSSQTPETFSEADKEAAEKTVRTTLGVGEDVPLDNFSELLASKVKEVPRYGQINEALKDTEGSEAVYALFKQIQASSDSGVNVSAGDGVLVESMKEGRFACAGRVLLSSTLLSERGIPHSIVFAPEHSFLIAELDADTLAYFDAQANMYFTFPKDAIGYQGQEPTQRYKMEDFTAREDDQFDGLSLAHRDFLAMDPKEALSRQYLMNVGASLGGNEEFGEGYQKDGKAASAIAEVEKELIGERPQALDEYYSHMEGMAKIEAAKLDSLGRTVKEIFDNNPDFDSFKTFMSAALQGELGDAMPYLKGANQEARVESIRKIYDNIKNEGVHMSEVDEQKPTDQAVEGPEALAERLEKAAQPNGEEQSTRIEAHDTTEATSKISETLEGEEKTYAEFIEKRNELVRSLAPALKTATEQDRHAMVTAVNEFCALTGEQAVRGVSETRQAEIEGQIIEFWKATGEKEIIQREAEDALDNLSYYLNSRKENGVSRLQYESPEAEQQALDLLPIFHVNAPEGWKSISPEDVSTIRKALNGDRTELVKSIVASKLL